MSRHPVRRLRFSPLAALLPAAGLLTGCGAAATTYVQAGDTTLGRVVVYRNGIAYFERTADVDGDHLTLKVPADKVDDFLKSLTVVDANTGQPAPISYPTKAATSETGLLDMNIGLPRAPGASHRLKLSYVTEAPSWKPSYRVVLGEGGKVKLEAWAIVDNTSGEDWKNVRLGVGSSSALSFRFDLQSVRIVERETLQQHDLFALAPPAGGATYGDESLQKKLIAELDEGLLAASNNVLNAPPPPAASAQPHAARTKSIGSGYVDARKQGAAPGRGVGIAAASPAATESVVRSNAAADGIGRMAQSLRGSHAQVIIEGFARDDEDDKQGASLARANKVREELVNSGVSPAQIVAVGKGAQSGRNGGVRVVEAPAASVAMKPADAKDGGKEDAPAGDPIGSSHFESGTVTTVARGTSAMVSILQKETEGEVVYLYDPESARGNARFPFRSVRLKNPSDSALETGPVTVFGDGHFIGEGMAEPIPARGAAFIPFALDRQILVDSRGEDSDEIARILTVQRGVFSTEVRHKRKTTFTLVNRLDERATVYVRHTVPAGYTMTSAPEGAGTEKLGAANLLRVVLEPHAKTDVGIEESTPIFKTIDVRTPESIEQVRVFLSRAAEGPLRREVEALLLLDKEIADTDQHIATTREQMGEYRARMNELHEQIFTLKAVRTAGPLMQSLEAKMQEISDKLSKATIAIVALEERRMVARVHFQDKVADLSLEAGPTDSKHTAL